MVDLYLDPITHDVVVKDFTLKVTTNEADLITQKLKIKLLWFKEEWFLDENYGIPYFQEVFVKGVNLDDIDDVFRSAIANEDGVVELISYSSSINESTRELTINSKIKTRSGEIVSIVFSV
jgi:hypothetical protein